MAKDHDILSNFSKTLVDNNDGTFSVRGILGIGFPVIGGDIGAVLFIDSSGNLGQDRDFFFWDDTDNELIINNPVLVSQDASIQIGFSGGKVHGIFFDGTTDPYTGTDKFPTTVKAVRTLGEMSSSTQEGFACVGVQSTIINNDSLTGSVTDDIFAIYNFYANLAGTHSDSVNWGDGAIKHVLFHGDMNNYTITATGTGHPTAYIGMELTLSPIITYNNGGGTFSSGIVGLSITSIPTYTLTSGSLNVSNTGISIALQGTSVGTSIGYGIYITSVQSFDTNWSIYSLTSADSYFQGNININNTTQNIGQLYQVMVSTTVPGHVIRGIAAQTANYLTIENSAGVDAFVVQPNTSASVPTSIIRTLFDSSDSVVARLTGPDRATPANFDRGSIEFYLDDSAGTQSHFAEIEFVAQTTSAGGRFGGLFFYAEFNSSNTHIMSLGCSASGGVGVLFNNGGVDFDYQFRTDNVTQMFYIDGGLDTATFGSASSLAFVGIDGQSDELQFLVQMNATQNAGNDFVVFETSAGANVSTWNGRGAYTLSPIASTVSATTPTEFTVTGAAHTGVNNSGGNIPDILFNLARNVTFAETTTSTLQTAVRILAPTYVAGSAKTITDSATFYINAAPTAGANITQTRAYSLFVDGGASRFDGNLDFSVSDTTNFVFGTTTGTKIGTGTTQKIGFYDATPIVQGASVADASGGAIIDAEARTAVNSVISRLEALGLIATV